MGVKNWKSSKVAYIVVIVVWKTLHIVVAKFVFKPLTPSFVGSNPATPAKYRKRELLAICIEVRDVFYSPTSRLRGAIFLILRDNRQATPNDISISPIPANAAKTKGILNVHLTMPIVLKNNDISGLITIQLITIPITVERITAGINERAVCKINCFVVKPRDLSMP